MITKSEPGVWCDYCKTQWGRVKNVWHELAMTEASITITSVNPKSHGQKRHYCQTHALEVTTFTNTTTHEAYRWSLQDQVAVMAPLQTEMEIAHNGNNSGY